MDYKEIIIPIRKIIRAINLDSKRLQKECGLSIPQLLALTFLSETPEFQSTQLELRKYLNLNSSTVTGIVGRLVKKGFIAKLPAREDKRATRLSLTSEGLKILEEAPPMLQDRLVSKLTQLADSELDQIKLGLSLLVTALGAEEIDAGPILTIPDPGKEI